MFESLVKRKNNETILPIVFDAQSKIQKRKARLESSLEGLGDLFKSGATKQKERFDAALKKLSDIKKEFAEERDWYENHSHLYLTFFEKKMSQVEDIIKGKKFNKEAYNSFTLPDLSVFFSVIENEVKNHELVLQYVKKILHENNPAEVLKDLNNIHYVWWEELDDKELTEEGGKVKASSAGYKEDFIQWALKIPSLEKRVFNEIYQESNNFFAFVDRQKSNINLTSNPETIDKTIKLCRDVSSRLSYVLHHVCDAHRHEEIISIAEDMAKECYK